MSKKNVFDVKAFLAKPAQVQSVEVEGAGTVFLRAMTIEKFQSALDALKDEKRNHRAEVVAGTLVDESGNSVCTVAEILSWPTSSANVFGRIYDAAIRINGFGKTDDADELGKQSGETQN